MGGTESLEIRVEGLEIRIGSQGGRVRTVLADGRPHQEQRGPREITETAVWQGDALEITASSPEGSIIRETLVLSGAAQLVHTVRIERPRGFGETRAVWVYDRRTDEALEK